MAGTREPRFPRLGGVTSGARRRAPRGISSASGLLDAALAIKANQGGFGSLRFGTISYR